MTEATIDDHDVLLSALSRFAAMLVSPYRVSDAMDELTRSVTEVLELDGAGVTLAKGWWPDSTTSAPMRRSNAFAPTLDATGSPCARSPSP